MRTFSLLVSLLLAPLAVLAAPADASSDSTNEATTESTYEAAALWTMKCNNSALDDACIYNKNGKRYCDAGGTFHSVSDPGTCNKVCHCIQ